MSAKMAERQRERRTLDGPRGSVEARVIEVVADQLSIDVSSIKRDSRIVADLNADSLDALEIVMAIEHEFGLEEQIPDHEVEQWNTVGDIIDGVRARLTTETLRAQGRS